MCCTSDREGTQPTISLQIPLSPQSALTIGVYHVEI